MLTPESLLFVETGTQILHVGLLRPRANCKGAEMLKYAQNPQISILFAQRGPTMVPRDHRWPTLCEARA